MVKADPIYLSGLTSGFSSILPMGIIAKALYEVKG
jgi:hypothetical protein